MIFSEFYFNVSMSGCICKTDMEIIRSFTWSDLDILIVSLEWQRYDWNIFNITHI